MPRNKLMNIRPDRNRRKSDINVHVYLNESDKDDIRKRVHEIYSKKVTRARSLTNDSSVDPSMSISYMRDVNIMITKLRALEYSENIIVSCMLLHRMLITKEIPQHRNLSDEEKQISKNVVTCYRYIKGEAMSRFPDVSYIALFKCVDLYSAYMVVSDNNLSDDNLNENIEKYKIKITSCVNVLKHFTNSTYGAYNNGRPSDEFSY